MIERIKRFFETNMAPTASSAGALASRDAHAIELATAALLIELSRADFEIDPSERAEVTRAVTGRFSLSEQEARELVELAELEATEATSLYQFTGLINDRFDAHDKARVIRMLWDVAVADGRIDRYEDHFVRKIADLIHVPHSVFIRTKHEALGSQ